MKRKDWGRIQMINRYHLRNKVARANEMQDDDVQVVEDEQMDDTEEAAPNAMGGGNPGTGQGMQLTKHMGAFHSTRDVVITYRQRHQYQFRNGGSGIWQNVNIAGNTTAPGVWYITMNYQWTDFHAIPSHIIGFYMTPQEMYDFVNPRHRTFEILSAGFDIKSVQVHPNTQIGGTDLRWQNINPPAPLLGVPHVNGKDYPYYALGSQPSYGPGAEDVAPNPVEVINFSFGGRQTALRLGVGYEQFENTDLVHFSRNTYSHRDIEYRPAPEWVGYRHKQRVWRGKNQNLAGITIANRGATFAGLTYHEPTHQTGVGYINVPSTDQECMTKADVRSKADAAPINDIRSKTNRTMPTSYDIGMWPVGPMPNNFYHQNFGPDSTMDGRDGSNMPFRIRTEDIANPDNNPADYTITMYLDTEMKVKYSLDHIGGQYPYQIESSSQTDPFGPPNVMLRKAHHMYGNGGWSHNHYRRVATPFPSVLMYSTMCNFPFAQTGSATAPTLQEHVFKTSEAILNLGFVEPLDNVPSRKSDDDEGEPTFRTSHAGVADNIASRTRSKSKLPQILNV